MALVILFYFREFSIYFLDYLIIYEIPRFLGNLLFILCPFEAVCNLVNQIICFLMDLCIITQSYLSCPIFIYFYNNFFKQKIQIQF